MRVGKERGGEGKVGEETGVKFGDGQLISRLD